MGMVFSKLLGVSSIMAAFLVTGTLSCATTSPGVKLDYTAGEIENTCDKGLADTEKALNDLAKSQEKRNFENTVLHLELILGELDDIISPIYLLKEVSTVPEVQASAKECLKKVEVLNAKVWTRSDLYHAIESVQKQNPTLDFEDQKLLSETVLSFQLSGAALSDDMRKEVVALKEELGKVQLDFKSNITNANDTIGLTSEELEGVPENFISSLKQDDQGRRHMTLSKATEVLVFLQNAKNEKARKRVVTEVESLIGDKNTPLLERAISLRHQIAKKMGFRSHAELSLQTRMAKSPEDVFNFLEDLRKKLRPKLESEYAELLRLKKVDDPSATKLNIWDWRYYDNQLRKNQYAVDQELVRQYFPMEHVVKSVLDVYQTVLEVKFTEISPASGAWAPDVQLFEIKDKNTDALIGHFYLDLYPRENKYNHFAAFTIRGARRNSDGSYRTPVSAVVGNFPKPTSEQPSLLQHRDVETFFHEFGHIMHQTLTTAKHTSLAGSSVRRDFVEAPSQMLENWGWNPEILGKVSKHYKTGEPLPRELLEKMLAAKLVNVGIMKTRQVFFALTDMMYHTMGEKVDTTAIWRKNMEEVFLLPTTEGAKPQATFGHLMGGYDAGYYGYLWSEVFAADMFTLFERQGLENPEVGRRYRQWILEPGGTKDPAELLRGFLGREPNSDAFLKSMGLSALKKGAYDNRTRNRSL